MKRTVQDLFDGLGIAVAVIITVLAIARLVRGGSVKSSQAGLRAANRARLSVSTRDRQYGFRVARSDD
jgi:formylglycine-generating enzyme required for sulfatase activity